MGFGAKPQKLWIFWPFPPLKLPFPSLLKLSIFPLFYHKTQVRTKSNLKLAIYKTQSQTDITFRKLVQFNLCLKPTVCTTSIMRRKRLFRPISGLVSTNNTQTWTTWVKQVQPCKGQQQQTGIGFLKKWKKQKTKR